MNYAIQRGTELEPAARAAYDLATGNIMEPIVMVSGDYTASLDEVSLPGDLILEVKCPVKGQESETWNGAEAGNIQSVCSGHPEPEATGSARHLEPLPRPIRSTHLRFSGNQHIAA